MAGSNDTPMVLPVPVTQPQKGVKVETNTVKVTVNGELESDGKTPRLVCIPKKEFDANPDKYSEYVAPETETAAAKKKAAAKTRAKPLE